MHNQSHTIPCTHKIRHTHNQIYTHSDINAIRYKHKQIHTQSNIHTIRYTLYAQSGIHKNQIYKLIKQTNDKSHTKSYTYTVRYKKNTSQIIHGVLDTPDPSLPYNINIGGTNSMEICWTLCLLNCSI